MNLFKINGRLCQLLVGGGFILAEQIMVIKKSINILVSEGEVGSLEKNKVVEKHALSEILFSLSRINCSIR